MPGADTWSAKEYKGHVYAGDMTRGLDVFALSECSDASCVVVPANTPAQVRGGGELEGELAEFTILEGTALGGRAKFSFNVSYELGASTPTGALHFRDRDDGVRVDATAFDLLTIVGSRATLTGTATVAGEEGVTFVLEIEDLGRAGSNADTFRLVTATGYAAFGVVDRGNISVEGG